MMSYVHDVAANLSAYCRNVILNSSTDAKFCRILFGPSLTESLGRAENIGECWQAEKQVTN